MKIPLLLIVLFLMIGCDRSDSSDTQVLDYKAMAVLAELKATAGAENPSYPTPEWRVQKDDDSYWESQQGSELYRIVLLEQIGHPTVLLNFLHHQGPKVSGLKEMLDEGMAAYVSDDRVRYVIADLYQYVPEQDRDLSFMYYMAIHDSSEGVRRNLLYQLPYERLEEHHTNRLLVMAENTDEWYPTRIGAAWVIAASGDERGVQWARDQRTQVDASEYGQLLDQVVVAGR